MKKHAYMIMAHGDFYTLEILIRLLDNERNDIYIHLDKKADYKKVSNLSSCISKSKIYFTVNRIDVKWGGASLVDAELELLETAIKRKYEYYHLLSGSDLPIKNQNYIHNFFDERSGKQFIGFNNFDKERKKMKYYYLFQEIAPRKCNGKGIYGIIINSTHVMFRILDRVLIFIQKILRVDRLNNSNYAICRGSQWFSITDSLARDIVKNKELIKSMCKYTAYPDEIFMQTFVYNSKYVNEVYDLKDEYNGCMRHIDWSRGWPYIFKKDDLLELTKSDKIFARKFNSSVDREIIDRVYKYVMETEKKCNGLEGNKLQ